MDLRWVPDDYLFAFGVAQPELAASHSHANWNDPGSAPRIQAISANALFHQVGWRSRRQLKEVSPTQPPSPIPGSNYKLDEKRGETSAENELVKRERGPFRHYFNISRCFSELHARSMYALRVNPWSRGVVMLARLQFHRIVAVKGPAHRETCRTYKMGSACFTTHVNPRVSVYLLFNLDVFYFAPVYSPYGP